jgi:alpha-N-arabinofuranosidase
VNIDSKNDNIVEIDLNELGIKSISGQIIASSKLQDFNSFDNPTKIQPVTFKGFEIKKGKLKITIPAFSVVVLEGK